MINGDLKKLYLAEAEELLISLRQSLIELEKEPASSKSVDEIFRAVHTLKGSASAAGEGINFKLMEKLAERMQCLFSEIRAGKLVVGADVFNLLTECVGFIGSIIGAIKNDQEVGIDLGQTLGRLDELLKKESG